jgi:hypothetical protein
MKKSDFIQKLKENKEVPSVGDIEKASQNVEKMGAVVKQFGDHLQSLKDMGVLGEDFDASKDYESETEFFSDMIDHLMYKKYKMTYFKPVEKKQLETKPNEPEINDPQLKIDFPKEKTFEPEKEEEIKPISQMSDSEFKETMDKKLMFGGDGSIFYVVNLIKKGVEELKNNPDSGKNALRPAYIALQDIIRKNLEENFADSKIFTIIAEAETPKISKKEILEYLNRNEHE